MWHWQLNRFQYKAYVLCYLMISHTQIIVYWHSLYVKLSDNKFFCFVCVLFHPCMHMYLSSALQVLTRHRQRCHEHGNTPQHKDRPHEITQPSQQNWPETHVTVRQEQVFDGLKFGFCVVTAEGKPSAWPIHHIRGSDVPFWGQKTLFFAWPKRQYTSNSQRWLNQMSQTSQANI